jgi:hypothetical protein
VNEEKMASQSYRQVGLTLKMGGGGASEQQIRELQRDLRSLGYLRSGVDGQFGSGTQQAVRSLQYDLINNRGASTGGEGQAPIGVSAYNRGRVGAVTGECDQNLVACIGEALDDAAFPKLPSAADPKEANRAVVAKLREMTSTDAPIPFLIAMFRQESGLRHFNEPQGPNQDNFIIVGIDRNDADKDRITSRGFGIGQYTLFHHPPTDEEVRDFMLDPVRNVSKAVRELRDKYDHFVAGATPGLQADDRKGDGISGGLRICKYAATDPRYMDDCKNCAIAAGTQDIVSGQTVLYSGTTEKYEPTQYYKDASYAQVPVRGRIGCDWPYAMRRYNGSGINSFHYQARVLKFLLAG